MKRVLLAPLALVLAALSGRTQPAAKPTDDKADSIKREISVGEIFLITLPCNPTTGYEWALKSINRRIAAPNGPVEFEKSPAGPGTAGVGGNCVLPIKGVKAGKTKAVLVYRRSWEKGAPAKSFTAEIMVLPKERPKPSSSPSPAPPKP